MSSRIDIFKDNFESKRLVENTNRPNLLISSWL